MIRDRLKSGWNRVLGRLGSPREAWTPPPTPHEAPLSVRAPEGIPPVQPGSGDTPGPNHKEDIGRPWAAAQLVSGTPPFFLDVRPAHLHATSRIPGAISAPGREALERPDLLPRPDTRVVVYDADGGEESVAVAAALREAGWTGARRLVGGFGEWCERGEPVETT